ncbi:MAG: glycerophosphodiester phosphodiesterase [Reyranellaceae bacterium]
MTAVMTRIVLLSALLAVTVGATSPLATAAAFDLQGHRGARGLAPENTLAGFRTALGLGVTTLETDLAVTRDDVVVLSHDPVLNPDIVRGPDGQWLARPGPALRTLSLAELRRYDIGRLNPASPYARQFPEQRPADGEPFPTLAELFAIGGPTVRFNIELKSDPTRPELAPDPASFARRVVTEVRAHGMAGRTTLQSFDWRTLIEARRQAPEVATSCLTIESGGMDTVQRTGSKPSPWLGGLDLSVEAGSVPRLAGRAGCAVWSPFWRKLTGESLAEARAAGLKVVPWTVNDSREMARLVDLGVDGLITDYPDRAAAILSSKGIRFR